MKTRFASPFAFSFASPWVASFAAWLGALTLGLAGCATPAADALIDAAAPPPVQVAQFRLDNGLSVIVKPDRRAPVVVHMLWHRVGAVDEVPGKTGLAHLLEHMMFKGTATLGPGEFSRRVAALGGQENAFTSADYTAYFQQIAADRLADVMRLEADRFATNRWSDDEFRKELEVVKEERRMRTDDDPRARLYEQLNASVFPTAATGRPIIGWMQDLQGLQPDDARAFWRRWYNPANAALVVVGDVQPQQVLQLARQYYGPIPGVFPPAPQPPITEPAQQGPRHTELRAPAQQDVVSLAFRVPQLSPALDDADSQDALALTMLAAVLDGYSGARLERALIRGQTRLADSVEADNGLIGRGPCLFTLSGVPAAGVGTDAVAQALRAEVARIAREGVGKAELERVKTQWMADEIYKRDSVMAQARELGNYWALGFAPDSGTALMARLRQITPAQVQAVAARYFGDQQMTTAVLIAQPMAPDAARRQAPPEKLR